MVCDVLAHHGISISLAEDVRAAFHNLQTHASAFLLLDMELEYAEFFFDEIATKRYDPPPYLIVANRFSNGMERVDILNRGADICIEKPVDAEEVLAVINAALRRTERLRRAPFKLAPCIMHRDLLIDPLRRRVVMEGRPIELTQKEFDILYLLASYPGCVFSKAQIYKHIWNDEYQFATTAVSDHISALRRKLGISAKDKRYIQTVYGTGYRFAAN